MTGTYAGQFAMQVSPVQRQDYTLVSCDAGQSGKKTGTYAGQFAMQVSPIQ